MRRAIIAILFPLALFAVPIRQDYGRVSLSNTVEFAPAVLNLGHVVDGKAYPFPVRALHPTREQYAALGWLPVVTNPPPVFVRGYEAVSTGHWYATNGVIRLEYVMRALPPRNLQLSKMKLKKAFKSLRVWDQVWEFISADEEVLADWNDSVVLDEQDVMVQSAFRSLQDYGVLTADQVEAVITNSVTEIEVRQ